MTIETKKFECAQKGCNKVCYLKTEQPAPTTNEELIKLNVADRGKTNTWNFQDGKLYGCASPSEDCPGTKIPRSRDLAGA